MALSAAAHLLGGAVRGVGGTAAVRGVVVGSFAAKFARASATAAHDGGGGAVRDPCLYALGGVVRGQVFCGVRNITIGSARCGHVDSKHVIVVVVEVVVSSVAHLSAFQKFPPPPTTAISPATGLAVPGVPARTTTIAPAGAL